LPLLRQPGILWTCSALVLILVAVAFSLSRGGLLALAAGLLFWILVGRIALSSSGSGRPLFFILSAVMVLGSWLGLDMLANRLSSLWQGELTADSRWLLVKQVCPLIPRFPFWGTGYGTFDTIEPMTRFDPHWKGFRWEHAHNDYLEILIEGGIPALLLTLLALGLVFRAGFQALRSPHRDASGLALGGLVAFTTLAVHSVVDFGNHIPAIALLATVLAAQLTALGTAVTRSIRQQSGEPNQDTQVLYHLGGPAPYLGAILLVAFAVILVGSGWKAFQVDRWLSVAAAEARKGETKDQRVRIAALKQAAQLAPASAEINQELGSALLLLYQQEINQPNKAGQSAALGSSILLGSSDLKAALVGLWLAPAEEEWRQRQLPELNRTYLFPGLEHVRVARNACPILSPPHFLLAQNVSHLRRCDTADVYRERGKLLTRWDVDPFFQAGLEELLEKHPDKAWESWRHCLELNDRYLESIVDEGASTLTPVEMVERLIPDKPDRLLAAARFLYPETAAVEERRPFLEKAAALLEGPQPPISAEDFHTQAVVYQLLGRPTEALRAYREALKLRYMETTWRLEYAQLLVLQGEFEHARQEVRIVIRDKPEDPIALDLMPCISRNLAKQTEK
jgi:tetratricopeptide (TPR) repeat protein